MSDQNYIFVVTAVRFETVETIEAYKYREDAEKRVVELANELFDTDTHFETMDDVTEYDSTREDEEFGVDYHTISIDVGGRDE